MNQLTLHRDPTRHACIVAEATAPIRHDATIDAWLVTDPKAIRELLRRSELSALEPRYDALPDNVQRAFPNLIFAFRHLPLSLNGEAHRLARRRMAEMIAANRGKASAAIEASVAAHIGRLDRQCTLDLMGDVLRPLVSEVLSALSGSHLAPRDEVDDISIVFDRWISMRRRREIDAGLGRAREAIRAGLQADDAPDEEGVRLGLHILGRDALLGTLGESLYRLIRSAPGETLASLRYPDVPPETGVPFVERRVVKAFAYDGQTFRAGERMRLRMQAMAYSDDASDRERIFGIGAHLCLGRQIGLEVWAKIVARLSTIDRVVEVTRYEVRSGDYTFTFPAVIELALN